MQSTTLYTVGYGVWPAKIRMIVMTRALKCAGITHVVDIRHAPCSAGLPPKGSSRYWPQPWHLQPCGEGIKQELNRRGIEYQWMVELGNPQKHDPSMAVMREQIRSSSDAWPIIRGLVMLRELMVVPDADIDKKVCLLCSCKSFESCHRKLVAETFAKRFALNPTEVVDLSS